MVCYTGSWLGKGKVSVFFFSFMVIVSMPPTSKKLEWNIVLIVHPFVHVVSMGLAMWGYFMVL